MVCFSDPGALDFAADGLGKLNHKLNNSGIFIWGSNQFLSNIIHKRLSVFQDPVF